MSSSGHYHRRWSAGTGGRTTPTSTSLTSTVEPSTYGTSWNSVRWNKPNSGSAGYRSLSTLAARFEPKTTSTSTSHYSPSPMGRSTKPSSLGPSISARASRFDTTVRDQKDKYRSEARELINKWTSRERNSANSGYFSRHFQPQKMNAEPSYISRKSETPASSAYPYRTSSITPGTRALSTSASVSRFSTYDRPNSTLTSPSPTPQSQWSFSTPYLHTLKAERPWRQRMAESQRIRATHGDEFGSRQSSRESSIYGPNSRFTSSFAPSSSVTRASDEPYSTKYMSRSYSPVRSTTELFRNVSSSRISSGIGSNERTVSRPSSQESISFREENREKHVSAIPKNPSIRESSKERDGEKRKLSTRERTARRNSRQRSLNIETTSSSEEETKDENRKQRRRKKKQSIGEIGVPPQSPSTNKSMVITKCVSINNNNEISLEPNDTVTEITNQLIDLTNKDEPPASPSAQRASRKNSRTSSRTRVPSKSQIIKSPSVVEVPGISKSESISSLKSACSSIPGEKKLQPEGSNLEDESQYSAVAHFKPFKPMVKRLAPVPGVWNKQGGEENISKNKALIKEEDNACTFLVIKVKAKDATSKKIRGPIISKVAAKKSETAAPKAVPVKKTETSKAVEKVKIEEKKENKQEAPKPEDKPAPKKIVLKKKTVKKTEEKEDKKKEVEQNTELTKVLQAKEKSSSVNSVWKDKPSVSIVSKKYKSAPVLREIGIEKSFSKKPSAMRVLKTQRPSQKIKDSLSLGCKATTNLSISISDLVENKEEAFGAQVIVDTPQKGVNISKVRKRVKLDRCSLPPQLDAIPIILPEKENDKSFHLLVPNQNEDVRRSSSRAAEVLDEMRDTEPAMEWHRDDLVSSGQLVLPDKSILEEYVRRKRGRLERLHSEPIHERDEISDRASPCHSTSSELLPACTSRIFNPSPYGHSYITTPSRNHSIEPSTPTTSAGAAMLLDSIQTTNFNNFNSTPQGFLRASTARIQCARPIQFEAPKSAFEERMQMQANAIRKASITSTMSDDLKQIPDGSSGRRGSDGMQSISSAFEAALAEKQQGNRHERYAAHIPVHRGEVSGRLSAASVDSSQSGVLETASKQLDQVIDQARHRHHQHRSKFKEAIDYLDQIFEDLKKECDPTDDQAAAPQPNSRAQKSFVTSKNESPIKKPTVVQTTSASKSSSSNPSKTNSLPTRGSKNKFIQPPSPLDVVITTASSSNGNKSSKNSQNSSEAPVEYAVTETIVLPKKTDKLDFTRRWLQDDLSSLAQSGQGPVNLVQDSGNYGDEDEHSLGSCSAEVAAINIEKIRKTHKPQIVIPPSQPAPIRPQPFRPQPGYVGNVSNNRTRHFPVDLEPHISGSSSLQRVASFDQMAGDRRINENHNWRSGSQEPYHTLQSVRSDMDSRPSPSAFHALGNRGSSLRASLRSLPDASCVRQSSLAPRRENQQPPMSIDQLVAELELNTDQPMIATDKRRSFPTSLDPNVSQPHLRNNNSLQRDKNPGAGVRTSYHAPANQPKPNPHHRYSNSQPKSLDEVTSMLNTVVSDMNGANVQYRRKPQTGNAAANALNGSQPNPFETINQEKINPSRVEAMHNMFERSNSSSNANNHNNNSNGGWRAGPQPYRRNQFSQNSQHPNNMTIPDEESYYDIAEFAAVKPYRKVSPPRQVLQTTSVRRASPSSDSTPAYPSSQPPLYPPASSTTRNGSANSSTNGGYYSSNSSMVGGGNQMTRRGSLVGRQSISSRAPSVDDEDDGFYDNIGVYDDRRYSHGSDMDVASISSRQLPPGNGNSKGTRLGSFLRKIGGRANRPPGSAASLISLNKVANEAPLKQGLLQKSNSMSSEPWKNEIMENPDVSAKGERGSSGGLGARLKNSLFGSKKRLNG